jgi:hypothetical protein
MPKLANAARLIVAESSRAKRGGSQRTILASLFFLALPTITWNPSAAQDLQTRSDAARAQAAPGPRSDPSLRAQSPEQLVQLPSPVQ